jgi:hypothetical protein
MASVLVSIVQPARHKVWHTIRGVMDIFHVLPPIASGLIFYLMAFNDQVRELYGSELVRPNYVHIVLAAIGFILVSCGLYSAHHLFSTIRHNIVYANFMRRSVGRNLRWIRNASGLLWAAAPWAGMTWGLLAEASQFRDDQSRIDTAYKSLAILGVSSPSLTDHDIEPAVIVGVAVVAIVGIMLLFLLSRIGRSRMLLYIFVGLALILLLGAAIVPKTSVDFVALYRGIGPLATLALEILCTLAVLTGLAYLARQSKFPAVTLVLAALVAGALFNIPFSQLALWFGVVCLLLLIVSVAAGFVWESAVMVMLCLLAFFAYRRDDIYSSKSDPIYSSKSDLSAPQVQNSASLETVQESFFRWWQKRTGASDQVRTPYPVYISAAQGGGIYAAAATALFLAKIQDRQPCFLEHVFAISGVSGGAIGATIFEALAASHRSATGIESENCRPANVQKGPLTAELAEIMEDDYFSPVVGAILPDLLGDTWGRAETLQRSFIASLSRQQVAASKLKEPYNAHWNSAIDPALVLNTTSAETGYRVAFAPFSFGSCRDRSLYAFGDSELVAAADAKTAITPCGNRKTAHAMPQQAKQAIGRVNPKPRAPQDVSLMFAAVASARFPLIVPPYSVTTASGYRLNFVDGGYADNSGSQTALDLYRAVKATPGVSLGADLKLILITSDNPLPDFQQIRGTDFGDTIAPISAVLQVRQGLSQQAVARVCDYFRQNDAVDEDCITPANQEWQLGLVKLEDQAYGLPLGWKISQVTIKLIESLIGDSKLIETLIGDPKLCAKVHDWSASIPDVLNNGCVLHDIHKSLESSKPMPTTRLDHAGRAAR